MRDIEEFLRSRLLQAPPNGMDVRMARLFAAPPVDARWWRRPMRIWQGIAAAVLIGLACYAFGRYQAATTPEDAVAKETVVYVIQESSVPGTRNAFDAPAVTPGQEWWRQTAQPKPDGGAI